MLFFFFFCILLLSFCYPKMSCEENLTCWMNFLSADLHIYAHRTDAEDRCLLYNSQWDHQRFSLNDTRWALSYLKHQETDVKLIHPRAIILRSSYFAIRVTFFEETSSTGSVMNRESWDTLFLHRNQANSPHSCWASCLARAVAVLNQPSTICKYVKNQAICKCMQMSELEGYFASVYAAWLDLNSFYRHL